MSRFLDLIDQAFRVLPKRFGGTGNDSGYGEGVVMPFNARAAIPLYSPVRVSADNERIATSTTEDDVQIVGVVVGKFSQLAGEPEMRFERSAPSNAELAAVMQLGRTPVRVFGSVSRDQYALQSTSAGLAKGSNLSAGAFGRFLAGGSNTVMAQVWPAALGGGGGSGSGGVDRLVAVSTNDAVPYYLGSKIVPGVGIRVTEQNDGSDESLVISALGSNTLLNPQRLVYWDDCSESSLPTGATSSGQLTFDSTRLRRELGGSSASEYIVPSQPLNGPLILEVIHENLSGLTAGNFEVLAIRVTGTTTLGNAAYQTDGNHVVYIETSARSQSGTGTTVSDETGHHHRTIIALNEQKVVSVAIQDATTGPLETTANNGRIGEAGAEWTYSGTLNAGDSIQFKLTTASTRKVAIYGVRVYRGAFAAPLGNTLALSSTTPAAVAAAGAVGTGSTAARSDHAHAQQALEASTGLSFGSGWGNLGLGYASCVYYKDGFGIVHVQGQASRTSGSGTTIGTLPSGYRPAAIQRFTVLTWPGAGDLIPGALDIASDGTITLVQGGATSVGLSGISFRT